MQRDIQTEYPQHLKCMYLKLVNAIKFWIQVEMELNIWDYVKKGSMYDVLYKQILDESLSIQTKLLYSTI